MIEKKGSDRGGTRFRRAGWPPGNDVSTRENPATEPWIRHGIRLTHQRRVIAEALHEADDHPDVEELYRRVISIDDRISIATVYRTVRILEEKGLLKRHDFGGGRARLDVGGTELRHHFIDVDTGKVIRFESAAIEALIDGIARESGLMITALQLNVFVRQAHPPLADASRSMVAADTNMLRGLPSKPEPPSPTCHVLR